MKMRHRGETSVFLEVKQRDSALFWKKTSLTLDSGDNTALQYTKLNIYKLPMFLNFSEVGVGGLLNKFTLSKLILTPKTYA